ncbi:MAG: DUF4160 domain-containing protein [Crocosphaera sp.]
MPTVLYIKGWRLFFYSNEGNEPIHIHGQKGDKDCKYWLDVDDYAIREAYTYNMNNKDIREVKKIILQNLDEIIQAWNTHFGV